MLNKAKLDYFELVFIGHLLNCFEDVSGNVKKMGFP
ncbi:uncharacterized protein METZ01_LOCUS370333 [marine metagenome]|uniref:Uncharacterized protein n=1 Tax=marine metagenome TaxID=408172 RepID=A0A382T5Q5_9ZZZZ